MSSTPRTAARGGSKSKSDSKGHKSDSKRDGPKNNDVSKAQAGVERGVYNSEFGTDELNLKKRISCIMDVMHTESTEDEVVTALHDCDYDIDKAVTMLLEGEGQGAWKKYGRKRKNRQANSSKIGESSSSRATIDTEVDDWDTPTLTTNQDRDRDRDWSRGRGGNTSRPRGRGGADNRGPGRGRDNNKENEGGAGEDGQRGARGDGYRRGGRGMSNGPSGRGGRGGRGGGRLGSRTFQGRDGRGGDSREKSDGDRFPSTIDTWNPPGAQDSGDKSIKMETWDDKFPPAEDWDNEEYTGSLADSQVFTKTTMDGVGATEGIDETAYQDLLAMTTSTSQEVYQSNALSSSPLPVGVGALSSAQAQYLSQLTQQTSENLKVTAAAAAAATAYGQTESLKSAVGIGGNSTYAPNAGTGQSSSYGQGNYSQSSYAAPTSYSASTGYAASSASANAYSAAATPSNAYSASAGAYQQPTQGYQSSNASSYGVYPSNSGSFSSQGYTGSNVSYDGSTTTSDASVPSAQPQRTKVPRPRMPPPSKIPSSAVEMPEDPISSSVSSLDVQFGCLEFGSDGTSFDSGVDTASKFSQSTVNSSVETVSSGVVTDTAPQAPHNAYSANKSVGTGTNQQSTLVAGLTAKGLSGNEGLSIQSSGDHKQSYNSQQPRAVNSTSGFDITKSDVGGLSYASAPTGGNYTTYQNQKNNSSVYAAPSYSSGSYAASQTTYSSSGYANQSSVNSSYSSQPANATNYSTSGVSYPSNSSFPTASQNYQSGAGSVYGNTLSSSYTGSNYSNTYSAGSATNKLNSGLSTTKESQEYSSSTTASTTTSSLLTNTSNSAVATTSASKQSSGTMKSSVVPNIHPPMMGGPQYIMSSATMPFYAQTPMYGYEDVVQLQRIPHMQPTGYFDMSGYSAPTSLATGRDSMPNVAFTVADARYSTRGDNASPVPSTLSQQTATAHQQPMMNPSFPPGYTYVYNAVPGNFQYGAPIFPVASAGNAHGSTSNQYGKPTSYGSTYGSGYDGLNQTGDYGKSAYVSGGVKSGVGGASVSSATTVSDLYGKAHTALGKVNSYDKQGFHSATPPPFNLATGQGAGAYPPQLFIPALAPHQQHPSGATALMPSHLQDSTNSSGQRSQSAVQPNKSGSKQNYSTYWSPN